MTFTPELRSVNLTRCASVPSCSSYSTACRASTCSVLATSSIPRTTWPGRPARNGLGGGYEIAGGIWVLLISIAALRPGALPRALNHLGIASATAGLVTIVPGLSEVGMVFSLGLIVWFAWLGSVSSDQRADHRVDETPTGAAPQTIASSASRIRSRPKSNSARKSYPGWSTCSEVNSIRCG